MATSTCPVDTPEWQGGIAEPGYAGYFEMETAYTKAYAGQMVMLTTSNKETIPAAQTTGNIVVGRAELTVDNSADDKYQPVRPGIFRWANASYIAATRAMIGFAAHVKDDHTVAGRPTAGTSSSELTLANTGDQAFTTQSNLGFVVGMRVRAQSAGGRTNYMAGVVKSYASTTLTITADVKNGTGSKTDWELILDGSILAGLIYDVDSAGVWVDCRPPAMGAAKTIEAVLKASEIANGPLS
jgi:hypothetical protein